MGPFTHRGPSSPFDVLKLLEISAPGEIKICRRGNLEGGDVSCDAAKGVLEHDEAGAQPAENC